MYQTPTAIVVDERTITTADGSGITLLRFRAGLTSFDLHVGSQDPPTYGIALPASAGYVVTPAERPQLLAAFNGGFKVSTGSGGVEVAGHVLSPLRPGYASLVIDASGVAHIGVWGQGLPARGEQVASVRQNLSPLVSGGRPSPAAGDWPAWGATLYGVSNVARSAVGEDAQGNIIYAASMHALPSDLATALIDAGAQTAMELDINPYWVQADVASRPGAGLVAAVPGQQRPADQYLYGWTRDFITVLSAGNG